MHTPEVWEVAFEGSQGPPELQDFIVPRYLTLRDNFSLGMDSCREVRWGAMRAEGEMGPALSHGKKGGAPGAQGRSGKGP